MSRPSAGVGQKWGLPFISPEFAMTWPISPFSSEDKWALIIGVSPQQLGVASPFSQGSAPWAAPCKWISYALGHWNQQRQRQKETPMEKHQGGAPARGWLDQKPAEGEGRPRRRKAPAFCVPHWSISGWIRPILLTFCHAYFPVFICSCKIFLSFLASLMGEMKGILEMVISTQLTSP